MKNTFSQLDFLSDVSSQESRESAQVIVKLRKIAEKTEELLKKMKIIPDNAEENIPLNTVPEVLLDKSYLPPLTNSNLDIILITLRLMVANEGFYRTASFDLDEFVDKKLDYSSTSAYQLLEKMYKESLNPEKDIDKDPIYKEKIIIKNIEDIRQGLEDQDISNMPKIDPFFPTEKT